MYIMGPSRLDGGRSCRSLITAVEVDGATSFVENGPQLRLCWPWRRSIEITQPYRFDFVLRTHNIRAESSDAARLFGSGSIAFGTEEFGRPPLRVPAKRDYAGACTGWYIPKRFKGLAGNRSICSVLDRSDRSCMKIDPSTRLGTAPLATPSSASLSTSRLA